MGKNNSQKTDIFISYRRAGGAPVAQLLYDKLTQKGYRVFFDVESLREGEYDNRLIQTIRNCTDFLIILTPGTLNRCTDEKDWVRQEINLAFQFKKNIIPILVDNFDFPEELPPEISRIRMMNAPRYSNELFPSFFLKLLNFLHSKPSVWNRFLHNHKAQAILMVTFILCVFAVVGYFVLKNKLFPFTPSDINTVNSSISYTMQNMAHLNSAYSYYLDALDEAESYAQESISAPNRGELLDRLIFARYYIEQERLSISDLPNSLGSQLDETPLGSSEFAAIADALRTDLTAMEDDLIFLAACFYDDTMSNATRDEIVNTLKEAADLSLDYYYVVLNQSFLGVRSSALTKLKCEFLPNIPLIAENHQWCTDSDDLTSYEETLWTKQQQNMSDFASIVGDERANLDKLEYELRNEVLEIID